jgi:hypothetical protein
MDFQEAMEGVEVSRIQVVEFVKEHGHSINEFFAEVGDKLSYNSRDVLLWLGY